MTVEVIDPQAGVIEELEGEARSEIARAYQEAMEALARLAGSCALSIPQPLQTDVRFQHLRDGEPATALEEGTA